ncbi:MAG: hypothetical protein WDO71_20165 [Bacteroidota bacterium]
MAKNQSGISSIIIVIVGIIIGTVIFGSIWSLKELAYSPRVTNLIGIWMIICFICIAAIGAITNVFNKNG